MFKSFVWMAAVVLIVTLNSCGAMPETPNIGVQEQPEVYYIHEDELIRQRLGQKPEALLTLPDMGEVRDALEIGETIFVLRERGLQKVSLADKSVDLVAQFPDAVVSGILSAAANQEMLIYSIDERVEIYHLGRQTTSEALSKPGYGFFWPLGLSADGEKLYLKPHSGDPEFPEVWAVNLSNGEIEPLSIGFGDGAHLSPNGRYLAIASIHSIPSELRLEYGLTLFDLSSPQAAGRILPLPNLPSYTYGLLWSPDSQMLYFMLHPGMRWDGEDPTTAGLWRLEVESQAFSQVATINNPVYTSLFGVSPDGEWILLAAVVEDSFAIDFVHIPTGKIETMLLPAGPIVLVRWR